MPEGWSELQKRISAANPAPYDENPEYRDFMMWYPPVSFAAYIAASCWTTLALGSYRIDSVSLAGREFPIFQDRIALLGGVDPISSACFASAILVGLLLMPVMLGIQSVGYWKTVLRHGVYKPVTFLSAVFPIRGCALLSIFSWVVFVGVPRSGPSAPVGMAGIFHWPMFPVLGSAVTWTTGFWIFGALTGF